MLYSITSGVRLTAGKSILEDLLETQELENAEVDSWVETETTLVRTEGGVVLNAVTTVDLDLALVVLPNNTELDDALGDSSNLEGALVLRVLLEQGAVLKGGCELYKCMVSPIFSSTRALEQIARWRLLLQQVRLIK
jgi:hypothetical protein